MTDVAAAVGDFQISKEHSSGRPCRAGGPDTAQEQYFWRGENSKGRRCPALQSVQLLFTSKSYDLGRQSTWALMSNTYPHTDVG